MSQDLCSSLAQVPTLVRTCVCAFSACLGIRLLFFCFRALQLHEGASDTVAHNSVRSSVMRPCSTNFPCRTARADRASDPVTHTVRSSVLRHCCH